MAHQCFSLPRWRRASHLESTLWAFIGRTGFDAGQAHWWSEHAISLCLSQRVDFFQSIFVSRTRIKPQAFLATLPLFKELSAAELEPIAAGTTELHVPRGEIVFSRGDPCDGFHLVVYGQIKLAFISPQGGEKVLEVVGPGFSFGEALMFMEKPYVLMAQALADSMLLHIARNVVFEQIERQPKFARKMLAGLSRRLHALITDVEAYSLQSGTERVVGYLLRQDAANADGDAYLVTLPTSKAVAASRLNVTPEHFSRILHDLVEKGMISVDGRDIRILDAARLRGHPGPSAMEPGD